MSSERRSTDDTVTYLGIDVGTSATKAVIIYRLTARSWPVPG